ncbi:hypothetical protein AGMMS4952_27540 [Spirochaetia bacterium]|nr:hypothetical protein AGMMS4952_27540 [Spirochaetia bacterium]
MKFGELVLLVLSKINTSSQRALNQYFEQSLKRKEHMSQQALSKARSHMNHKPFEEMFREAVAEQYNGEYDIEVWEGYQILALDGSTAQLPSIPKLAREYGTIADAPTARISILYDVLNDIILDGRLATYDSKERELAKAHIEQVFPLLRPEKTIVTADRGYPSADFIGYVTGKGLNYVIRCSKTFNTAIEAARNNEVIEMDEAGHVRVLKFTLEGGEEEVLLTNLYEVEESRFKALYFLRWKIESKYGMLKQKHILENFSGYSTNVLLQDFWATLHVANMCAVARNEANEELAEKRKDAQTKYEYVVNYNEVVGSMKDVLLSSMFVSSRKKVDACFDVLSQQIKSALVPIRPNRTTPRPDNPRNAQFRHNRKINC